MASSITRRNFVAGFAAATGALCFMGARQTPDGYVSYAFADEKGKDYFAVYLLNKEEVPVLVLDVKDGKNIPVAGAQILVTSNYNQKTTSATTDAAGCAVVNIRALTDGADDDEANGYSGWMEVEATKDGYRTFHVPSCMLESGVPASSDGTVSNTLQIPTEPNDGGPYLSNVSFDGVDIQYSEQTATIHAKNDMWHELIVAIENAGAKGAAWDVAFLINEKSLVKCTAAADANGQALVTFKGQWLDGSHGIKAGDVAAITFTQQGTQVVYKLKLPLTFEACRMLIDNGYSNGDFSLSVGNESASATDKSTQAWNPLPTWFVNTNDSFVMGLPYLPVNFICDAFGNFGLSMNIFTLTPYKNKFDGTGGGMPDDAWKCFLDNCGKSWVKSFEDKMAVGIDAYFDALPQVGPDGDVAALGAAPVTTALTATYTLDVQAIGSPITKGEAWIWHADLAAIFRFAVAFNASQQLFICGFPAYWTFDLSAAILAKIMLGIQFEDGFHNLTWGHQLDKFKGPLGIVVDFCIEMGLGAGIGVYGVVSIGIRGYGQFQITVVTDSSSDIDKKHTYPRTTIKLNGNVQLIVQLLLFKKTVQLTDIKPLVVYDSSPDETLEGSTDEVKMLNSRFGTSIAQLTGGALSSSDLEEVTEASLADCVEFSGNMDSEAVVPSFTHKRDEPLPLDDVGIQNPYCDAPTLGDSSVGGGFGDTANGAYNPLHGIRPAVQNRIWSDVFSAPRPKVVVSNGVKYMLRLAIVEIDTYAQGENVRVVKSDNGCLFVQACEGNDLPRVSLGDAGELVYPEYSGDVCMAELTLDANTDLTTNNTDIVDYLTKEDTLGTPVNTSKVSRSRLIISAFNESTACWTTPSIIDFALPTTSTETMRANTWDMDFDVAVTDDGNMYIGLCSMTRPYDSEVSYDEQFKRQFVTVLRYDANARTVSYAKSSIASLAMGYTFWNPRVAVTKFKNEELSSLFYYCWDKNERGSIIARSWLFDKTTGESESELRFRYVSPDGDDLSDSLLDGVLDVNTIVYETDNYKTFTACLSFSVGAIDSHVAYTYLWAWNMSSNGSVGGSSTRLDNVSYVSFESFETGDKTATARWVYTIDTERGEERLLHRASMKFEMGTYYTKAIVTTGENVGRCSGILRFFSSYDGTKLFAARAKEGTAPGLNSDAIEAVENGALLCSTYSPMSSAHVEHSTLESLKGGEVEQYQLVCADYDSTNKTYHEFFVLADVSMPPDFIVEVPSIASRYDFIVGSVTNLDKNLLDLYHICIPKLTGLQLEGAISDTHFAMEGSKCYYSVRVSNTGNVPLSGFTLIVEADDTGTEVCRTKLSDLASAVVEDEDFMRPVYDKNGVPTGEYEADVDVRDENGILWPGKSRTYKTSFTMPKGYESGKVGFRVFVSQPVASNTFTTMATSSSSTFTCVDPRARLLSVEAAGDVYATATVQPAEYLTDDDDDDNGDNGKKGDDNGGSNGKVPDMGDHTSTTVAGVAAAAAAAAAAVGVAVHKLSDKDDSKK